MSNIQNMANQEFGVIRDEEVLTAGKLALRLGKKERWAKEKILAKGILYTDLGGGCWQIVGLHWRMAMERIAMEQHEAKED